MALTNISFTITEDGLARAVDNEDNISAILFSVAAPSAYSGSKIRGYTDIASVKADGIISTSVTYGEAYYHISEFFRVSPGALLYVCFGLTDVAEELYNASGGKIRQYATVITALSAVEGTHQAIINTLNNKYSPAVAIVGYEPAVTPASVNDVDDLSLKTAPYVAVVAFGDANGKGAALAGALGKPYISAYGLVLGLTSKAKVQQSIGELASFNISDGVEYIKTENGVTKPAIKYVTGQSYSDGITLQFDNKRYIVPRFYAGNGGVFIEKDNTAYAPTKDLSNIRNVRTISKALRGVRSRLLTRLKTNVPVDDAGKLDADFVEYLKNLAGTDLVQMQRDGEISRYGVSIDPNQNVLSTDLLDVDIKIIPIGVNHFINVKLGFTRSLTGFQ